MFENFYEMFDRELVIFRKAKKKTYEERMTAFRAEHGHYIDEILMAVAEADDKQAKALECGSLIAESVFDHFAWHGKISTAKRSDLTLFMIYYVFPGILMTENENAKTACDGLLVRWSEKFKCPNMGYTTYDELLGGFSDKIFGLF